MRTSGQTITGIRSHAGSVLAVKQTSIWKGIHELRAGEVTIGTMTFTSLLGHEATVSCPEGSWRFRQSGFWKPKLTVEDAATGSVLAEVPVGPFARTLTITLRNRGHEKLTLELNLWATRFTLTGRMGHELVRLESKVFSFASADIHIGPKAAAYEELPWMLCLVWYLATTTRQSQASVHVS